MRLLDEVRGLVAARLGVAPEAVGPAYSLREQGIDSLACVAIAHAVSQRLGRTVSPVAFWSCPTVAEFAAHPSGEAERAAAPAVAERARGALADAGIAPSTLRESRTGVFTRVLFNDHDALRHRTGHTAPKGAIQ